MLADGLSLVGDGTDGTIRKTTEHKRPGPCGLGVQLPYFDASKLQT